MMLQGETLVKYWFCAINVSNHTYYWLYLRLVDHSKQNQICFNASKCSDFPKILVVVFSSKDTKRYERADKKHKIYLMRPNLVSTILFTLLSVWSPNCTFIKRGVLLRPVLWARSSMSAVLPLPTGPSNSTGFPAETASASLRRFALVEGTGTSMLSHTAYNK